MSCTLVDMRKHPTSRFRGRKHIEIYVCMYVCMYAWSVYTHTHTHTHIYIHEGRTESHDQLLFACELGTADEGVCGGRWNQPLCYP